MIFWAGPGDEANLKADPYTLSHEEWSSDISLRSKVGCTQLID